MGSDMNCGKMRWFTGSVTGAKDGLFYDFTLAAQNKYFEYEIGLIHNKTNYQWTSYNLGDPFPPNVAICGFHSNGQPQYIARMDHSGT